MLPRGLLRRKRPGARPDPDEPYTGASPVEPTPIFPEEFESPPQSQAQDFQGYSGRQAAEIIGITYRQLDYWARTDLIRPSLADSSGSGTRRRYSYRDLLELKVVKNLLDAGIRLESVRDAFSYLREHLGEDVASVNLVISGRDSVLVSTGEELIDLLRERQGVVNVLPLAGVQEEVDAAIVNYPTSTPPAGGPSSG
jgi:DNA-binding transcriptional MerR regulator